MAYYFPSADADKAKQVHHLSISLWGWRTLIQMLSQIRESITPLTGSQADIQMECTFLNDRQVLIMNSALYLQYDGLSFDLTKLIKGGRAGHDGVASTSPGHKPSGQANE